MLVDELCVGVRTSEGRLDGFLDAALRSHVVPQVEAPPNLSLLFGDDHGPAHAFHFLYRGHARVVRAASLGRLLRATLAYLDGFADPRPGTTRLNAKILCHDGGAVLIDPSLGYWLETLERRLRRIGLHTVDAPAAVIDRSTLDVVLEAPWLDLDADVLAELDHKFPPPVPEDVTEPGARPVLGLVVPESTNDELSPAQRFSQLTPLATDREGHLATADLEILVELTRSRPLHRVPPTIGERELLQLLTRIVS